MEDNAPEVLVNPKNLLSITNYAKARNLSRISVYKAIWAGNIKSIEIDGTTYIDTSKYGDFTPIGKQMIINKQQRNNHGDTGTSATTL